MVDAAFMLSCWNIMLQRAVWDRLLKPIATGNNGGKQMQTGETCQFANENAFLHQPQMSKLHAIFVI